VTHFYKMKAGDNLIVYFASNQMFEQGQVIPSLTARVKAHENREDKYNPGVLVKQTVITRAKLTPRTLTKEDKKAIAKLKRILKAIPYNMTEDGGTENYEAHKTLDNLIIAIQEGTV
jgi:hypothetical protein